MSAIVAGLIPKIEGFQPIPNAVMIPFMEAQSAALAYGFGLNYEFGKRKIRSMSNTEFNSLTSEQIAEISNQHSHVILNAFQKAVPTVMPMQQEIFKQYVIIEKLKVEQNVTLAKWMVDYAKRNIDDITAHALGGHIGHTDLEKVPISTDFVTPKDKFINPTTGEQGSQPSKISPSLTIKQKQEVADKKNIDLVMVHVNRIAKSLSDARKGQPRNRGTLAHSKWNSKLKRWLNSSKIISTQILRLRTNFKNKYGYWY